MFWSRALRVLTVALTSLAACGDDGEQRAFNQNSSRSNHTRVSIIVQPDAVLPDVSSAALVPRCVEVQLTAGDDDPSGRAYGDPIHGVDVKLGCVAADFAATATTDADGVARFCDLAFARRGAFVLLAEAEGADADVSEPFLVARAPRFVEWIVEPASGHVGVPLRGADGSCPKVRVRAGLIMAGGADGSSDAIAYRAGDPVHGVDVKLGHSRTGATVAGATTDTDGVATFCDLVEQQSGAVSYEPWTPDDGDEAVVSNPLYEPSSGSGVSPLFQGRSAVSRPVLIGPYSSVLAFTREPPSKLTDGAPLDPAVCPLVTAYAAAGFSGGGLEERMGAPRAGVAVTVSAVPGGAPASVTTGADGSASICDLDFGSGPGAYNLRAAAPGARPALSAPISVSP